MQAWGNSTTGAANVEMRRRGGAVDEVKPTPAECLQDRSSLVRLNKTAASSPNDVGQIGGRGHCTCQVSSRSWDLSRRGCIYVNPCRQNRVALLCGPALDSQRPPFDIKICLTYHCN